jgi:hypothetical protein
MVVCSVAEVFSSEIPDQSQDEDRNHRKQVRFTSKAIEEAFNGTLDDLRIAVLVVLCHRRNVNAPQLSKLHVSLG